MSSPAMNLYAVLGVADTATAEDIRQAYRDRAKAIHPDAGGSVAAMSELNEAYRILSDSGLRREYDDSLIMEQVVAPPSSAQAVQSEPIVTTIQQYTAARDYVLYHLEQFGWLAAFGGIALTLLSAQPKLAASGWMIGVVGFGCIYWLVLQLVYLAVPELKISNYRTVRAPYRAGRRRLNWLLMSTLAWAPLGIIWELIFQLLIVRRH